MFEYWVADRRPTKNNDSDTLTHLALAWAEHGGPVDKTLCGRSVDNMAMGDETASGISATCKRCKTIFRNRAEKEGAV
jgi:hypothetical protein